MTIELSDIHYELTTMLTDQHQTMALDNAFNDMTAATISLYATMISYDQLRYDCCV